MRAPATGRAAIDPEVRAWRPRPRPPAGLEAAQERATVAMARLRELQIEIREGRLVETATVRGEAFAWGRQLREAWLAWPGRVGGELAAQLGIDGPTFIVALEAAVHAHLKQLAGERVPYGEERERVQRRRPRRSSA